MKKIFLILLFCIATIIGFSQGKTLLPGENFTNQSTDTLLILKAKVVRSLVAETESNDINLEKIKLYQKQLGLKESRILLADSAITIKRLEADYWRQQLLQNDEQLEAQRIENMKLIDDRNRIRQSRIYYFVAGIIGGVVLFSL